MATWVLVAVVGLTGILALMDPEGAAEAFGLIPSEPWRLGGTTWLTSSLAHRHVLHLLFNVALLWEFGGKAEAGLGSRRWLAMIASAELVGRVVHVLLAPDQELPCVGISGSVLAAIAYYVLRFPGDAVEFRDRRGWIRWSFELPAWGAVVPWLMTRGLLWLVPTPATDLSALAQCASALVGIGFWLRMRPPADR